MDFLSAYYGAPKKKHKSKAGKGFVIVKGKAYPIGSGKAPKKRRSSGGYGSSSMWPSGGGGSFWGSDPMARANQLDNQFSQTARGTARDVYGAYQGGKAAYGAIKGSRVTKAIGKKLRPNSIKNRKERTFLDNIRTKKMEQGTDKDYFR